MSIIVRVVILTYYRTSTYSEIITVPKKTIDKEDRPLETIPPSHHAVEHYAGRSHYMHSLSCHVQVNGEKTSDGRSL